MSRTQSTRDARTLQVVSCTQSLASPKLRWLSSNDAVGRFAAGRLATTTSAASARLGGAAQRRILVGAARRAPLLDRSVDREPADVAALRAARVQIRRAASRGLRVDRLALEAPDALVHGKGGPVSFAFHANRDSSPTRILRCVFVVSSLKRPLRRARLLDVPRDLVHQL